MSKAPMTYDDDDDDDDYDETGGGNRLLGFMFGNVDDSGDLDADYLDEDAKEHLAALADKLGTSLTDIDLSIKSPQNRADASEQDYDIKAENAVDYEDIDEEYDGPEIHATSEEDHLLPKKEYFSAEVSLASLGHKTSVFDEENYDEDENYDEESNAVDNSSVAQTTTLAGSPKVELSLDNPCSLTIEQNLQTSPEKGITNVEHTLDFPCSLTIEQNLQTSPGKGFPNVKHSLDDPCSLTIEQSLRTSPEKGISNVELSLDHPCSLTIERNRQTSPEKEIPNVEHGLDYPCSLTIEQNLQTSPENDQNVVSSFEDEKFLEYDLHSFGPLEAENQTVDLKDFQDEHKVLQEPPGETNGSSLPILFIEDGMVVLRFSEIFGIHEPLKKREKRKQRYPAPKERYKGIEASVIIEDDEELFFRGLGQDLQSIKPVNLARYDNSLLKDGDAESMMFGEWSGISMKPTENDEHGKDSCRSAEPMKEGITLDLAAGWGSFSCPEYYPLDRQDWEDEIIWDNSPSASHESVDRCSISGLEPEVLSNRESELEMRQQNLCLDITMESAEKHHSIFLHSCPVLLEPFGSRKFSDEAKPLISGKTHPQLLRLETRMQVDHSNGGKENDSEHLRRVDAIRNFRKLSLQNTNVMNDSWLDKIIWESTETVMKPKLILDLQDEQMLFEILETKDGRHLRAHAGAMIITRSLKASAVESFDLAGQGGGSIGRFNISNDKYYSNRKTSQQLKSHSKKRAAHGVKVLHSTPALTLQTLKPKLSNKDIANFHRPKALWYPHDNEVAAKEQGKLCTQGPMKLILKSMGGKGSKLHVSAEETVSSVKAKASKKLDFKPSEKVKIFYSGKELDDVQSLAAQNVRPNSLLHLVRTKIHLWPRAQKLPGENKSLRPPGAFKKKSDLSVKDGHVFLMEYCEERPLMLGNVGMGARLCTYYQKSSPGDQTASLLRSGSNSNSLGNILTLDPADKSPFLGDIKPGCSQSCLETNMYRAPIFMHKLSSTDFLLVRSAKGKLSLRRIDRIYVVGQQEPHMEVISPGTKNLQTYVGNRLLVYIYREFRACEKRGLMPCVRADELSAQFSNLSEPFLRKRLKHCADLQKGSNNQLFWVMKRNFRIPLEEELRRMVTPENVCMYESMQAGLYRLKRLGISKLTHPSGLSSAMNQLPDEAIALAAASHIERELQITPWNLTSNFVACTSQDRENIERLEITGVGDPSGRGLGFSYVRVAPKAPISSAVVKKKVVTARGSSTVTGTDADLRRLSMEAAREVLLKFNVPEEQIAKQTRWHRIAMIRKLSSEQAASGVKVDATTISKYARGQRMSFLQLQQQTREKCQEIWDRQVQSLTAADGDENESDSEANSDLDSFAGDLENLLDAEECGEGEEGNYDSRHDKAEGLKGLKMWRRPYQVQAEEEIEDEAAEAAELCRMLMDDDEAERRKKKKPEPGGQELPGMSWQSGFGSEFADQTKKNNKIIKQIIRTAQPDGSFTSKENFIRDPKEVESILAKRNLSGNVKFKKGNGKKDITSMNLAKKKTKVMGDGSKVIKEKKHSDKPVRESFVCGACGQLGHMRTNKNCPKYGEEVDMLVEGTDLERVSGKQNNFYPSGQLHQKTPMKKLIAKGANKIALVETTENSEKVASKTKILPLKLKCGPGDKLPEKIAPAESQNSEKHVAADSETGVRSAAKISKIIISNKSKHEDLQVEPQKPSIVIRPPVDTEQSQPRKKIIIKHPKGITNVVQVQEEMNSGMHEEYRKTKKMSELANFEKHKKKESKRLADEAARRKAEEDMRLREEQERRRAEWMRLEQERLYQEQSRMQAEQQRLNERNRYKAPWKEEEELERQKAKKKKKKKPVRADEYFDEPRSSRNDRRMPERNRAAKRRPVADLGRYGAEYAPQTKRRRGGAGEVGLANILETIVDSLKDTTDISFLFLKPVSKKEAPDYLDIIEQPMDLSTIKEKVRKMEYKHRDEFRHDVFLITYNAHKYNDRRNPGIPPLADQLLELCDYYLEEYHDRLDEAEAGIESRDT